MLEQDRKRRNKRTGRGAKWFRVACPWCGNGGKESQRNPNTAVSGLGKAGVVQLLVFISSRERKLG